MALTRIRNWWLGYRWFRKCWQCGRLGAKHYRQRTSYENERSNWVSLCPGCAEENDAYWDDMWDEYYRSRF